MQPSFSVSCLAPTVHLCQPYAFNAPVLPRSVQCASSLLFVSSPCSESAIWQVMWISCWASSSNQFGASWSLSASGQWLESAAGWVVQATTREFLKNGWENFFFSFLFFFFLSKILLFKPAFHTAHLSNLTGDYPGQGPTGPHSSLFQVSPSSPIYLVMT